MESLDMHQVKLQEKIEMLKKCQNDHKITSCLKCKDVIGCEVRKTYINAVYQSMNKGEGGGFEF